MKERFDQLAKGILSTALVTAGQVSKQEEIVAEVQAADVWFVPLPERTAERARLGLLGRMAETPCLLEPFHATPGGDAVLDCLRKQLTLRHNLLRDARKQTRQESPATQRQDSVGSPRLWILSSGRPQSVIEDLAFTPLDGSSGIWQAPRLLATFLVVLRDLPATRETLPLRLLGAGPTFRQAVKELRALPAEDWEAELLIPELLAFSPQIFQDFEEDPVSNTEIRDIFAEWDRRVRQKSRNEGLEEGREQGYRRSILDLYEVRFRTIPDVLRAALEATEDEDTLRRWVVLAGTGTAEEIAAAVLAGRASDAASTTG
ncbi:MAG TPA: hypothetical protein VNM90_28970 [Haliangium sp.]|nr:hypothetical protein [Haliangium sp.]